jgi:hypothetical protein
MNALASLFKRDGLIEKHQLEGVDPSDRYFNRAVLVNRTSSGYAAKVMYEALIVEGQSHPTNPRQFQRIKIPRRKRNLDRLPRPHVILRFRQHPIHQIVKDGPEDAY